MLFRKKWVRIRWAILLTTNSTIADDFDLLSIVVDTPVFLFHFRCQIDREIKKSKFASCRETVLLVVLRLWLTTSVSLNSWCNCYRRRKWTRRHEFKSWTKLIAFHIALIPLGKVWIQLFSLQLWVNSRRVWFFSLGEATSLGEGKLWIQTC